MERNSHHHMEAYSSNQSGNVYSSRVQKLQVSLTAVTALRSGKIRKVNSVFLGAFS
jgi:hypothetical protein